MKVLAGARGEAKQADSNRQTQRNGGARVNLALNFLLFIVMVAGKGSEMTRFCTVSKTRYARCARPA